MNTEHKLLGWVGIIFGFLGICAVWKLIGAAIEGPPLGGDGWALLGGAWFCYAMMKVCFENRKRNSVMSELKQKPEYPLAEATKRLTEKWRKDGFEVTETDPPLHPMEAMRQSLNKELRDLGCKVTETGPSRTGKLVATFVPRRAESTSPPNKSEAAPPEVKPLV